MGFAEMRESGAGVVKDIEARRWGSLLPSPEWGRRGYRAPEGLPKSDSLSHSHAHTPYTRQALQALGISLGWSSCG